MQELLSGESIAVRIPQALRSQLASIYSADQLDGSQLTVPSVRWEATPSPHPEPAQNAAPQNGVHLHSGGMTTSAVDLRIKGRGLDFVFERTYRSQSVGDGPFGPGWDHSFKQHPRELPSGDVELYDGSGRRDLFKKCQTNDTVCKSAKVSGQAGQYQSPVGIFSTLQKTSTGFQVIDPRHRLSQFDAVNRMTSRSGGTLSESASYDGLHRLVHAQSGNQSTDLAFDSLSRRLTESLGTPTVSYTLGAVWGALRAPTAT